MYFHCACRVFCEDTIEEGQSHEAFVYKHSGLWDDSVLYNRSTQEMFRQNRPFNRGKFRDEWDARTYYEETLDQYTLQDLTYQSGALAALEGITSALRQSMEARFVYGIPKRFFNDFLL